MKRRLVIGGTVVLGALLVAATALAYLALHRVAGAYLDAEGVRIHYTVEGEGDPVVLVHGYSANADLNWRLPRVIARLRQNFRVIAFDNRGHGLSGKPHEPRYGLEMVHDVRRVMDHLKIERAHIVGYSMGGFITLKFVALYPDRVLSAMPCGMAWMEPGSELTTLGQRIHAGQVGTWEEWFNDLQALKYAVDTFGELAVTEPELRSIRAPMMMVKAAQEELVVGGRDFDGVIPGLREVLLPRGNHSSVIFYRAFRDTIEAFLLAQSSPS